MNEPENRPETGPEVLIEPTPVTPSPESVETPVVETETVAAPVEEKVEAAPATEMAEATSTSVVEGAKRPAIKWQYYAGAVAIVVVMLGALVYVMEQQGRLQTGIFDSVENIFATRIAVATVNDGKITKYDLAVSMSQMEAGAKAQGADLTDPKVQADIQTQSIDMLVNTELLKQEAVVREIVITDEDVEGRLESLKTEVGGEDVLKERMKEFNIDEATLRRDIRNELTIKALLDMVFAEKTIEVTEAEITALYEQAGGLAAGLPPLAQVRSQIEAQIRTGKEQEVVTTFIDELRAKATIEVLI